MDGWKDGEGIQGRVGGRRDGWVGGYMGGWKADEWAGGLPPDLFIELEDLGDHIRSLCIASCRLLLHSQGLLSARFQDGLLSLQLRETLVVYLLHAPPAMSEPACQQTLRMPLTPIEFVLTPIAGCRAMSHSLFPCCAKA